jgi:hypothetical protein
MLGSSSLPHAQATLFAHPVQSSLDPQMPVLSSVEVRFGGAVRGQDKLQSIDTKHDRVASIG